MESLEMATKKRLVDAHEVEELFYKQVEYGATDLMDAFDDALQDAKTVDAVEVVHGQWEQVQRWATKAKYRCSVCGREIMSAVSVNIEKYPYCHCGAKMDGEKDG